MVVHNIPTLTYRDIDTLIVWAHSLKIGDTVFTTYPHYPNEPVAEWKPVTVLSAPSRHTSTSGFCIRVTGDGIVGERNLDLHWIFDKAMLTASETILISDHRQYYWDTYLSRAYNARQFTTGQPREYHGHQSNDFIGLYKLRNEPNDDSFQF